MLPAGKFVHERGILCAELVRAGKFVHERGILCAELVPAVNFVHGRGILCAELLTAKKFVHEKYIPCTNFVSFWPQPAVRSPLSAVLNPPSAAVRRRQPRHQHPHQFSNLSLPSANPTWILPSPVTLPPMIWVASSLMSSFWRSLFIGRAP